MSVRPTAPGRRGASARGPGRLRPPGRPSAPPSARHLSTTSPRPAPGGLRARAGRTNGQCRRWIWHRPQHVPAQHRVVRRRRQARLEGIALRDRHRCDAGELGACAGDHRRREVEAVDARSPLRPGAAPACRCRSRGRRCRRGAGGSAPSSRRATPRGRRVSAVRDRRARHTSPLRRPTWRSVPRGPSVQPTAGRPAMGMPMAPPLDLRWRGSGRGGQRSWVPVGSTRYCRVPWSTGRCRGRASDRWLCRRSSSGGGRGTGRGCPRRSRRPRRRARRGPGRRTRPV